MKDYYKILGISQHADDVAIKWDYKSLAMQYHPDIYNAPYAALKFIEITEANDVLINSVTWAEYDLKFRPQFCPPADQVPPAIVPRRAIRMVW